MMIDATWRPTVDRITRRDWIKAGVGALGAAALDTTAVAGGGREYSFHYDHVVGTSLDVWLTAADATCVRAAESAVLDEIDRLCKVFSTFDPDSELSRLNRSSGLFPASADLRAVLREYERWQLLSSGACNAQVGSMTRVWADAERRGVVPSGETLADLAERIARPGWHVDDASGTVTRLTDQLLNLNSVAKGYILGRAAEILRAFAASGLANLGGDMAAWGGRAWPIGVQNPFEPADNARPSACLYLLDASVATSGGYLRSYTVGGTRYSHLFDPRTGRPADGVASATVLAGNCVTANVLATTLCVLGPDAGLRLVASVPGTECLIVTAAGRTFRSPGLNLLAVLPADDKKADDKPKGDPWPEGFRVTLAVEVPKIENVKRYRRPYVAVWLEDADGKPVRTLTVWGNSRQYLKDMTDWWKIAKDDKELLKTVTRATRAPGKYDLTWDGKDDKGNPVPQGTYTVRVEVCREFGQHALQSGKIDCKAEPASLKLEKNEETGESAVDYGKKK
jgi:thiamine biosynthesis lipoprotein ApbE